MEKLSLQERVERIIEYFEVNKNFGQSKSFQQQYYSASAEKQAELVRRYEVEQIGRCLA